MENQKEEYPKSRKIKTADGTIMHLWGKSLHSWEGPALIPKNNKKLEEYYVYGIKYTKDKWLEAKKEQAGLPWYKSSMKTQDGARF